MSIIWSAVNCVRATTSFISLIASARCCVCSRPRPGETVRRGELNGGGTVNERAVDVQINRLRRKIERDPANPLFLQAVRGVGYRLVAAP